jgi:hypothetical protein
VASSFLVPYEAGDSDSVPGIILPSSGTLASPSDDSAASPGIPLRPDEVLLRENLVDFRDRETNTVLKI